jgi:hypothetical protein
LSTAERTIRILSTSPVIEAASSLFDNVAALLHVAPSGAAEQTARASTTIAAVIHLDCILRAPGFDLYGAFTVVLGRRSGLRTT